MSAPVPCCAAGLKWLRANHGKGHLAPLTGQDMAALTACIHVIELYAYSDATGKRAAIEALRALVTAIQPHCRKVVKEVIPFVLDFPDVPKLWPLISGEPSP